MEMPYAITFGNHGVSGHEEWYGNPVSMIDFGPELSILNFGQSWQGDLSHAYALLESRRGTRCKVINAYEHDAPVEELLDRYERRIQRFIHEKSGRADRLPIGAVYEATMRCNLHCEFCYVGDLNRKSVV